MLYDRYQSKMYRVCLSYIRDPYEAESVMIDSFYQGFTKIYQLRDESRFEAWLRRIVVHKSLEYIQKDKKYQFDMDIEAFSSIKWEEDPTHSLQLDDVLRVVRDLPTAYRTVFNLFVLEGYRHDEIADQLGIPINTSKSNLRRARIMLKTKLEKIEKYTRKILSICI